MNILFRHRRSASRGLTLIELVLVLAIGFGAAYKSMETAANGVALAIEKRVTEKQPAGDAYGQIGRAHV